MLIGIIVIVVILAIPSYLLMRRLREGEQAPGGSMGSQTFGKDDDDWGPKPS